MDLKSVIYNTLKNANRCSLETLWKREEVKKVMWSEVPKELKNQLENYIVEE